MKRPGTLNSSPRPMAAIPAKRPSARRTSHKPIWGAVSTCRLSNSSSRGTLAARVRMTIIIPA